jgi:hypothetical protein
MAKILKCVKEPLSNKYLPEPFKIGEKVLYLGEIDEDVQPKVFRKQFITIKRLKSKRVEHVARKNFEVIKKR